MANYCTYEVHIKGPKKAALMVYAALPWIDYKELYSESGNEECYIIHASGCCKWALDQYTKDVYRGKKPNLDILTEEQIRNGEFDESIAPYWNTTLQIKSKILNCEIEAHSWSEESQFDSFESYKNGEIIKSEAIAFCAEQYEWDKDEYPDYMEFCEEFGVNSEIISESDFVHLCGNIYEYNPRKHRLNFSFSF